MSDYKKSTNLIGEQTEHPSYGTLGFSRRTGGKTALFGSSIKHSDTIAMTLRHADVTRGLNSDWFHGGDVIAEAEMSYAQFAEAITSMNMGTGVPVTLRFIEGKGQLPPCDFISKKEQFQNELKESLDETEKKAAALYSEVAELFAKKTLTKADKVLILDKIQKATAAAPSHTEFAYKCFNEQMDKTMTEAKGEIEEFYQNKINTLAQLALVEHADDVYRELNTSNNPVAIESTSTEGE